MNKIKLIEFLLNLLGAHCTAQPPLPICAYINNQIQLLILIKSSEFHLALGQSNIHAIWHILKYSLDLNDIFLSLNISCNRHWIQKLSAKSVIIHSQNNVSLCR